MKKLILLLFIPLVFACSSDDDSQGNNTTPSGPTQIKFTLEKIWSESLFFDDSNTQALNSCYDDNSLVYYHTTSQLHNTYGIGTGSESRNHFSLDTLSLTMSNPNLDGYNITTLNSTGQESTVNPQYIGHIELNGFDSNHKILILKGFLEYQWNNQIEYFSSNVSEAFLNSLVYDVNGLECPTNQDPNIFIKSTMDFNSLKLVEHTVVFDELNDNINIGNMVGYTMSGTGVENWKPFGEGWNGDFNPDFLVVNKEYIY
tara:strand:- start:253 stop:1026 length:774 start_codon:yes stop_codon:yes gene_type:complete